MRTLRGGRSLKGLMLLSLAAVAAGVPLAEAPTSALAAAPRLSPHAAFFEDHVFLLVKLPKYGV